MCQPQRLQYCCRAGLLTSAAAVGSTAASSLTMSQVVCCMQLHAAARSSAHDPLHLEENSQSIAVHNQHIVRLSIRCAMCSCCLQPYGYNASRNRPLYCAASCAAVLGAPKKGWCGGVSGA